MTPLISEDKICIINSSFDGFTYKFPRIGGNFKNSRQAKPHSRMVLFTIKFDVWFGEGVEGLGDRDRSKAFCGEKSAFLFDH